MAKISSRCVDRLRGYVKRGLHRRGITYYASWLVDDHESPFSIMTDYFHWFSSDGGFMSVYDIPRPEVQSHRKYRGETKTPNSIRSPFWIMVSGLAISPLIVVTPDSRAYL